MLKKPLQKQDEKKEILKIVPDTNVLISAFITDGNEYQILKLAKQNNIKILLSPDILDEFEDVIKRPRLGFSFEQINSFTQQINNISEKIYPSETLSIIKEDPDDDKILEAASKGKADYIISGDNHLLNLKEFRNIKIVNASTFLTMFNFQ
jgi:uncharacterized protein